jgi:hypothetical protein
MALGIGAFFGAFVATVAVAAPPGADAVPPCPVVPLVGDDCPPLPTQPTVPPLPPVPGDHDADRIVDTYENHLLQRFAPRIWLNIQETSRPANVGWLLARSTLRFGHARCSDDQILPFGDVTNANLTEQSHRSKHDLLHLPPWDACAHFGDPHPSDGYQGDIKSSFFLQFHDDDHKGTATLRNWVVYGHVQPASGGRYVVQYWQLYAYDDSLASSNHEGDWEYSAVVVDRDERPQQVVFFRHGHSRTVAVGDAEWIGDHHVTYSAKGSHAQYRAHSNGRCVSDSLADDTQGLVDHCDRGTAWDSWTPTFGGIVNVGEKAHPLNDANWLRYSGLWGEVGLAADVIDFTSGPRGPADPSSAWNWLPSPAPPPPLPPPTTTTRPPTTTTTTRPPTTTTRPPQLPPCPPQLPNCQEP